MYTHPGDRDVFPVPAGKVFAKKEDSQQAIEYFQKFLDQVPDDLTSKWLLNYAYMTVGAYPAGVPAQYLIPPSVFESKEDAPHFVDVAEKVGVKLLSLRPAA